MAIARGAGTEIIRTASFEFDSADQISKILIIGAQHHIYTVLSLIVHAKVGGNGEFELYLEGYDSDEGTTAQNMIIFNTSIADDDTFVWNDKFSFNGFEPTDFAGPMDSATKQDAIADQGSSVAQKLIMGKNHNSAQYEVMLTYIDQNNA
jgi:hypothetical protein